MLGFKFDIFIFVAFAWISNALAWQQAPPFSTFLHRTQFNAVLILLGYQISKLKGSYYYDDLVVAFSLLGLHS